MLLSATFPLDVHIILLDTFSNGSSFYVAYVCSHCHQKNHNRLPMNLTRSFSCISEFFSSYRSFYINLLEFLFLTNYIYFDEESYDGGSGSIIPGMALFHFALGTLLVVFVNTLVVSVE